MDEERGIRPHGHYGKEGQEGHSPQEFVKGKGTFAPHVRY